MQRNFLRVAPEILPRIVTEVRSVNHLGGGNGLLGQGTGSGNAGELAEEVQRNCRGISRGNSGPSNHERKSHFGDTDQTALGVSVYEPIAAKSPSAKRSHNFIQPDWNVLLVDEVSSREASSLLIEKAARTADSGATINVGTWGRS